MWKTVGFIVVSSRIFQIQCSCFVLLLLLVHSFYPPKRLEHLFRDVNICFPRNFPKFWEQEFFGMPWTAVPAVEWPFPTSKNFKDFHTLGRRVSQCISNAARAHLNCYLVEKWEWFSFASSWRHFALHTSISCTLLKKMASVTCKCDSMWLQPKILFLIFGNFVFACVLNLTYPWSAVDSSVIDSSKHEKNVFLYLFFCRSFILF